MTAQGTNSLVPKTPKWWNIRIFPEIWTLCITLSAFVCFLILADVAIARNDGLTAGQLWKMIGFHMTGGASVGVAKGATIENLPLWYNIGLNVLYTVTIICGFNTLVGLSLRKVFRIPLFDSTLGEIQQTAQKNRKMWVKFGVPGVFIFVLFPLTSTGPLVGTVLGRLIGLGFWTNLVTVTTASISTILLVGLAAEKVTQYVNDKVLSYGLMTLITILIFSAGLTKFIAWRRKKNPPAAPPAPLPEGEEEINPPTQS